MSQFRHNLWYARGFSARAKHVEFPTVNYKGCKQREAAFRAGWLRANALFQFNRTPYSIEEVLCRERLVWNAVQRNNEHLETVRGT